MKYQSQFWDERYSEEDFIYGEEPNEFFKEEINKLEIGKLLLPCEGEGRNAVYAQRNGWTVDAFDSSKIALEKCNKLSEKYNTEINYKISDAMDFEYGENKYDLIAFIYCHFPPEVRKYTFEKSIKALKSGGMILLEGFNTLQINKNSGGPKAIEMLYTEEILKEHFKTLDIQIISSLTMELNEGKYHNGESEIIRMIAYKK